MTGIGASSSTDASPPVGPVHRAFHLLQLVVAAGEPIGVRELARRAGMSRSTTGRTLGILAELGMIERTADGAASPGVGLAALRPVADAAIAREHLRPLVAELSRRFGENAGLAVDDVAGVRYLMSIRADHRVQVPDPLGEIYPFHLVAPGLVAMSSWSADRLEAFLSRPLESATERSVTDPDAIRARLSAIRHDGFAWTDQELDDEVNGLAVAIRRGGEVLAIATLYGPSYRFAPGTDRELGPQFATFVAERSAMLL